MCVCLVNIEKQKKHSKSQTDYPNSVIRGDGAKGYGYSKGPTHKETYGVMCVGTPLILSFP